MTKIQPVSAPRNCHVSIPHPPVCRRIMPVAASFFAGAQTGRTAQRLMAARFVGTFSTRYSHRTWLIRL
jgi:hypothetical protein